MSAPMFSPSKLQYFSKTGTSFAVAAMDSLKLPTSFFYLYHKHNSEIVNILDKSVRWAGLCRPFTENYHEFLKFEH